MFVADSGNNRVQVLTPSLGFHCFIGRGALDSPLGVCANDAVVVVVSEQTVAVFNRGDGALLRRFGRGGSGDGELLDPCGVCFMSGDRHIAVAEEGNYRVSVFSVDGEFIRHIGVGVLLAPHGIAASAFDELVVGDAGNVCLRVFSSTGDLLASVSVGRFSGVAMHGGTLFAADPELQRVSVFT